MFDLLRVFELSEQLVLIRSALQVYVPYLVGVQLNATSLWIDKDVFLVDDCEEEGPVVDHVAPEFLGQVHSVL